MVLLFCANAQDVAAWIRSLTISCAISSDPSATLIRDGSTEGPGFRNARGFPSSCAMPFRRRIPKAFASSSAAARPGSWSRTSNNGCEFRGRPDQHPYELFLQLQEIERRTTKVRRPQSNGFIEPFHRTLLDEHLRVMGRTKWYESVEEMRADLDQYLDRYNRKRPLQGRGWQGRVSGDHRS